MRVLVAHDGSPCADAALQLVTGLRWPAPARLTLVSVIDRTDLIGAGEAALAMAASEPTERELVAEAQRALEAAAERLRGPGRTVETRLEHGRPGAVIVELAAEMLADLVVVGSRGLGPWSSLLLGSVSTEVVDHAPCPVLVARHDRVDRLVVATDGSESADRAIDTIGRWGLFTGLPAQALSVERVGVAPADWAVVLAAGWIEDRPDDMTAAAEEQRRLAEHAADRLRDAGLAAEAVVRFGHPARQIAEAGRGEGDLIVMGSRGLGTFQRLVLGSVARTVLQHTGASVLIIRRPHATRTLRAPIASLAAFAV